MASAASLEGFYFKPRIDKDLLAQHRKGIIGLSACLGGEIAKLTAGSNGALDPADYQARLDQADANYRQAQTTFERYEEIPAQLPEKVIESVNTADQ